MAKNMYQKREERKNKVEDNEPIPFIKLTEEQLKKLNYEEIIAITISERGAMGFSEKVEIIVFADDKLTGYETFVTNGPSTPITFAGHKSIDNETNSSFDGLSYYELHKVIPWLKKFRIGIGCVLNVGKGWRHIYTGYGNHLLVREFLDDDLRRKLKDKRPSEVYNLWKPLVAELCSIKNYAKEVTFKKQKQAIESIYKFIDRNITSVEDLPKMIKETNLTEDDILGLFNIIEGLVRDEPKQGISVYKAKEKLFEAILSKKEKLCQNIKYLNILCMIKNYLELSQKDSVYISDIQNILNSLETKELVKSNIEFFKLFDDIIYISSNIQDFDIYNEVYAVFKESIINGREDEAAYLINYLVLNNKDSIHDILTWLKSYLNKFDNIGDPEPIINFEDNLLVSIIQGLENYPLEGIDLIIKGLMYKSMHPRNASINVIKKWMQLQDNCAKDYLPLNLYNALLELKNKEVIKFYKEGINQILGFKEDLSNYNEPKVRYYQEERMTDQDKIGSLSNSVG